jgi:hypothetical protein
VDENYRHVVVNINAWLPGVARDEYHRARFKVRDLTIERV